MKRFRVLSPALVTLVMLSLLVSACSRTEMFYFFAGKMLLNRIDQFFDIDPQQEKILEEKIAAIIAWHKAGELPRARAFLEDFSSRLGDGWSRGDMDWVLVESKSLWVPFMDRALPDFAQFLTTLDRAQIDHARPQFEKRNQFLIDSLAKSDQDLLKDSQDWLIGLCEDWLGPLTDEQEERIKERAQNPRAWHEARLRERTRFNGIFLGWLEAKRSAGDILAELRPWVVAPEAVWTPGFREKADAQKAYWSDLALFVDSLITPAQRKHGLDKIQGYIEEIRRIERAK